MNKLFNCPKCDKKIKHECGASLKLSFLHCLAMYVISFLILLPFLLLLHKLYEDNLVIKIFLIILYFIIFAAVAKGVDYLKVKMFTESD